MPVSQLHAKVASVALAAAAPHGFALGGGNALLAHEIITRPTQDVDLFTDQEHGVQAAEAAVEAALRAAGFELGGHGPLPTPRFVGMDRLRRIADYLLSQGLHPSAGIRADHPGRSLRVFAGSAISG